MITDQELTDNFIILEGALTELITLGRLDAIIESDGHTAASDIAFASLGLEADKEPGFFKRAWENIKAFARRVKAGFKAFITGVVMARRLKKAINEFEKDMEAATDSWNGKYTSFINDRTIDALRHMVDIKLITGPLLKASEEMTRAKTVEEMEQAAIDVSKSTTSVLKGFLDIDNGRSSNQPSKVEVKKGPITLSTTIKSDGEDLYLGSYIGFEIAPEGYTRIKNSEFEVDAFEKVSELLLDLEKTFNSGMQEVKDANRNFDLETTLGRRDDDRETVIAAGKLLTSAVRASYALSQLTGVVEKLLRHGFVVD